MFIIRCVDLMKKRKANAVSAHKQLCNMFCDKDVTQVRGLPSGEDVSNKYLDRSHFEPRTNSLYIKLERKVIESN
jgi:hypothetical protein